MRKRQNQKKFKILPIIFAALPWLALAYVFFFIDPIIWRKIYYAPFFALLISALFFTLRLFIKKNITNLLISLGITFILFLRSLAFKEIYFPILIILIVITLIYFFTTEESNDKLKKIKAKEPKNANQQEKN